MVGPVYDVPSKEREALARCFCTPEMRRVTDRNRVDRFTFELLLMIETSIPFFRRRADGAPCFVFRPLPTLGIENGDRTVGGCRFRIFLLRGHPRARKDWRCRGRASGGSYLRAGVSRSFGRERGPSRP